ncbi:MAG: flagellar brake protein [Chloroflexi bacterium]|nr:flagellar brake protein [Chloroflexota bacterium]MBI4505549.1 flagellar brake protein [Chloroflexota bacterium]
MAVSAPEIRSVFFEPGRRVRVQPLQSERAYHCFIEEVPNGTIHLSMPMEGREYAHIPTGQRVQLAVERRGNLYLFESIVTGRRFGDNPLLILKRPADQAATQRRQHARVPVLLDAVLWYEDAELGGRERDVKITIVNVSAGGLGFRTKEHIEAGRLVHIDFAIPSEHRRREPQRRPTTTTTFAHRWARRPAGHAAHTAPAHQRAADPRTEQQAGVVLTAATRVVHCAALGHEPERDQHGRRLPRVYRGGVEFVGLDDLVRERIIRFVMRREVELRCRGLL